MSLSCARTPQCLLSGTRPVPGSSQRHFCRCRPRNAPLRLKVEPLLMPGGTTAGIVLGPLRKAQGFEPSAATACARQRGRQMTEALHLQAPDRSAPEWASPWMCVRSPRGGSGGRFSARQSEAKGSSSTRPACRGLLHALLPPNGRDGSSDSPWDDRAVTRSRKIRFPLPGTENVSVHLTQQSRNRYADLW